MNKKEEIGEIFEQKVCDELKRCLPENAIIMHDSYFVDRSEYINKDLGYKTLQMDIIVICGGVFVVECKYLSDELYTKIENCKTKTSEYEGKVNIYMNKNGKEVRRKSSSYGLRQNKSHYEYLSAILNKRFGYISVKAVTVYGGIDRGKVKIKNEWKNNYVKHESDFYRYIKWAVENWNFAPMNEKAVASYLQSRMVLEANIKERHKKQVEYFKKQSGK